MSPPWMPLYIADYRADTAHLGAAEHGAYLLLIMHYWQKGSLPQDDRLLARISCMTPGEWAEARPVIADLFGPGWTHRRIDAELAHADEVISKRKAAAHARYSKSNANASAHAEHMHGKSTPDASYAGVPPSHPPSPVSDADASDALGPMHVSEAKSIPPSGGMAQTVRSGFDRSDFEQFWQRYPHRVGKQDALKAFLAIRKQGSVTLEAMMAGLDRYIRTKPPDRSWCNPGTWLRQGRWEDEPSINDGFRGAHSGPPLRPSGSGTLISAMVEIVAERPDAGPAPAPSGALRVDAGAAPGRAGDVLPFGRASGTGIR